MWSKRALGAALVGSMLGNSVGSPTAPITVLDVRNCGAWYPNERVFLPNERMMIPDRKVPGFIRVAAMTKDGIKRVPSLSYPNLKRSLSEISLSSGEGADPALPSMMLEDCEAASAASKRKHSIKVLGVRAQTTWYPNELQFSRKRPGSMAPYLPPPMGP